MSQSEQPEDISDYFSIPYGADVAALGVDLKHAFCLARGTVAELSETIVNLNEPQAYADVSSSLDSIEGVAAVACDLHPDLHSSILAAQLAERLTIPLIPVQHHHAHIASVMAEHALEQPVIGLALDGFGYGADGTAWGGECLRVDGAEFTRLGNLKGVPMPGGDASSREPWRMAVAWLDDEVLSGKLFPDMPVASVQKLCTSDVTAKTSSAGRLFDAASAIVLGHAHTAFEGEAAIALEREAEDVIGEELLPFEEGDQPDFRPALRKLAELKLQGVGLRELAASFHLTVATAFADLAMRQCAAQGIRDVVLAGGCFLNRMLDELVTAQLEEAGLNVWKSERLPKGDGGIALGQAWVARCKVDN